MPSPLFYCIMITNFQCFKANPLKILYYSPEADNEFDNRNGMHFSSLVEVDITWKCLNTDRQITLSERLEGKNLLGVQPTSPCRRR